jgi:hypothetical protein
MKLYATNVGILAALGLILLLFFNGCENPSGGGDSGPSAQELAAEFRAAQSAVLEKTADTVNWKDEEAVNAAIEAYEVLDGDVKELLAAEKAKLDGLKTKVTEIKRTVFTALESLLAYLAGQPANSPSRLYSLIYTGNETPADIYNALGAAGRYVSLDLSESGVGGFDSGEETGREFIVSLTLPDTLTSTPENDTGFAVFKGFSSLRIIRARNLSRVGDNTFESCTDLAEVDLPKAISIGARAFYDCLSLSTVKLPEAWSIGNYAFQNCRLTAIELPKANRIGWDTFNGCTYLEAVSLPQATNLGPRVFLGCKVLKTVNLSNLIFLRANVFQSCTALETVSLPRVTEIGNTVFQGCTSLTTVILGAEPPVIAVNARIFTQAATVPKTITFKVPDITAYTTAGSPWLDNDKMGLNSANGYYWDNSLLPSTTAKENLTVALESL